MKRIAIGVGAAALLAGGWALAQMAADPGAFGVLSQFLTMAVLTVFVGLLYVVIIDWSFSLINVFPARVFKWIDGIGDDLGAGQR